jgi:Ulp1 protease family, C-terminal catalytic domain
MTNLELEERRKSRLVFCRKPRPGYKKRVQHATSGTETKNIRSLLLHLLPNRTSRQTMEKRPKIDETTLEVMKLEIQDLLRPCRQPVTVLSMANALLGSRCAFDSFAHSYQVEHEGDVDQLERVFHGFSIKKKNKALSLVIQSRYQLTNALNRLQQKVGACGTSVSSWKEALDLLKSEMDIPEADGMESDQKNALKDSVEEFRKRAEEIHLESLTVGLRRSLHAWQTVAASAPFLESTTAAAADKEELEKVYADRDHRWKDAVLLDAEDRLEEEVREREAQERATELLCPLSSEEIEWIEEVMEGGASTDIIAQTDTDSCQRKSLCSLRPGAWLNDEVIHYFLVMLAKRDEEICKSDPNRARSHFFKSFFITKLRNEGHSDPSMEGKYEYRNVKRWSKNAPGKLLYIRFCWSWVDGGHDLNISHGTFSLCLVGKDLFKLEKIFFPINEGQLHWTSACIFMKEKRIQFYDSFGGSGESYLEDLFQYLQDEHIDKKGYPLPDADKWKLVPCTRDTPHQKNGFDCGVFTCMFIDFLAKDCPLVFGQDHITQCRNRIALSILQGKAIM